MFEFAFLGWLAMSFAGWVVGRNKGRPLEGLLLGLVLGFIGLVIIAVMRPKVGYGSRRVGRGYGPGGQLGGYPNYPGYGGYPQGGYPQEPVYPQEAGYSHHPGGDPYSRSESGYYGYGEANQASSPGGAPSNGLTSPYDVAGAPAWRPDPSGRWDYRWWDGHEYTPYVSRGGVPYTDSLPI